MLLLSGPTLREAVERVTSSRNVACAVAFWGRGAEALFGNPNGRTIRIICNLQMGGTNPMVINRLMDAGIQVKQCNTLHAKVYIGNSEAVVTSANASINGLGLEEEAATWIETGVVIPAAAAITWFDRMWKASRIITRPQDIEQALAEFRKRKATPRNTLTTGDGSASGYTTINVEPFSISANAFHGKSVREAAMLVLSIGGKPLTARGIADKLEQGGFKTAARRLTESVTDMFRTREGFRDFVQAGGERGNRLWALTSWPEYAGLARQIPPRKTKTRNEGSKLSERTQAGLLAARQRGVDLGRRDVMTPERISQAEALMKTGMPNTKIAEEIEVSRGRFYRWLQERGLSRRAIAKAKQQNSPKDVNLAREAGQSS